MFATSAAVGYVIQLYCILPRVLADEDGCPYKSIKSHWTEKLSISTTKSNCQCITMVTSTKAVIIDVMFMIHTKPLRTTTMADYSKVLYNQHALEHFKIGIAEVHLVFDNPTINKFNPKQFEQVRCHKTKAPQKQYQHHSFIVDSQIPQGWQEFMECSTCKRAIVDYISYSGSSLNMHPTMAYNKWVFL